MTAIQPDNVNYLITFIKEQSGIALTSDKVYLLESRLLPVARESGFPDINALAAELRKSANSNLKTLVTEAMTTHETSFFRDLKPFQKFREVILPHTIKHSATGQKIRIWSAACSSGQEPYSIGMCFEEEKAKLGGRSLEILATDISDKVLDKAKKAVYSQFEVQRGMPIQMLIKYFTQANEQWQVKDFLRNMVQFRQLNLLESYASIGKFDIVFCRNVLIYFDDATKKKILENIALTMNPKGILFLGSTETIIGLTPRFVPMPSESGIFTLV